MKTLYDLLGALPDDDAEGVRAAFRKAVKGAHPDINPGDPDAALKFRQIVRANEILSDEEQRAAYDHLLDLARLEQKATSRRSIAAVIDRLSTSVMACAVVSTMFLGGYLLFEYVNGAPVGMSDVSGVGPAKAAAFVAEAFDTLVQTDRLDKAEDVNGPKKLGENPENRKEATAPSAIATAEVTASTLANAEVAWVRDFGINDAKYYRQRGMLAYRSGDLYVALADFDLAIQFDSRFSDAYIDRAIVFRRMGDLKRAFADVADARRIDDSNRNETASIASQP